MPARNAVVVDANCKMSYWYPWFIFMTQSIQIERQNMSQNIKREIQIMKMLTHIHIVSVGANHMYLLGGKVAS